MIFVLISLLSLVPFRRLGWFISKNLLYWVPNLLTVPVCLLWGAFIAYLLHLLIGWQNPGLVVKIIFGYLLAAYLSIPDYGLFNESTMPPSAVVKNTTISFSSLGSYIAASIILAFV
jgi:hypothetical protein